MKTFLILAVLCFTLDQVLSEELSGIAAVLAEEDPAIREKRKAKAICKKGFKVDKGKTVSISSKDAPSGNCDFDLIGDTGCDVELHCTADLPGKAGDCGDSALKISDGVGGHKEICGKTTTDKLLAHAADYRDLFVEASGTAGHSWSCSATCSSSGGKRIPKSVEKKEEFRCVCGLQNKDDRIVGGEDAKFNEFPWQTAVVYPGTRSPMCGATVLNDRFILTAAHCFWFDKAKPEDVEVLIHAHTLDMTQKENANANVALGEEGSIRGSGYNKKAVTDKDEHSLRFKVAEIINHPLFTEQYDYDYAILRLEKKIDLVAADSPTPICLPDLGGKILAKTFDGTKPWVVGWGMPDEKAGGTTRVLQKLEVPIIGLERCQTFLPGLVTQRMICAGYEEGGKDACTGDSGGPLILKKPNKQWQQIGVVSWGEGCARKNRPGLYSRVTEMQQWILKHSSTNGAKWCRSQKN